MGPLFLTTSTFIQMTNWKNIKQSNSYCKKNKSRKNAAFWLCKAKLYIKPNAQYTFKHHCLQISNKFDNRWLDPHPKMSLVSDDRRDDSGKEKIELLNTISKVHNISLGVHMCIKWHHTFSRQQNTQWNIKCLSLNPRWRLYLIYISGDADSVICSCDSIAIPGPWAS